VTREESQDPGTLAGGKWMGGDDDNKLLFDNRSLSRFQQLLLTCNGLRLPFEVPKTQGYETEKSHSWLGGWLDSEHLTVWNFYPIVESLKRLLLAKIIFIRYLHGYVSCARWKGRNYRYSISDITSVRMRLGRDSKNEGDEAREEDWNL
jgi:hypothetical protein